MFLQSGTILFLFATILTGEKDSRQEDNNEMHRSLLEIKIGEEIIQQGAELSMPIRIKGVQKTPLGNLQWIAIITNPVIDIHGQSASFVADVLIDAGVIKFKQKISGHLDPRYIEKQNRIIIKPVDVVLKVDAKDGPMQAMGNLDMTDNMPNFEIPVSLPNPVFKVDKRLVKVSVDPEFEFIDGALLITTPVRLTGSRRR